jgi:hypothetical protein
MDGSRDMRRTHVMTHDYELGILEVLRLLAIM